MLSLSSIHGRQKRCPRQTRGEARPARERANPRFSPLWKPTLVSFSPWLQLSRIIWKNKLRELPMGQVWYLRLHLVLGRLRRADRSRATWGIHQVLCYPRLHSKALPQKRKEEIQRRCGGLNDNDPPQRLIGSGTTRKCRLVGVGVALLEEVSPQGWAVRFQKL